MPREPVNQAVPRPRDPGRPSSRWKRDGIEGATGGAEVIGASRAAVSRRITFACWPPPDCCCRTAVIGVGVRHSHHPDPVPAVALVWSTTTGKSAMMLGSWSVSTTPLFVVCHCESVRAGAPGVPVSAWSARPVPAGARPSPVADRASRRKASPAAHQDAVYCGGVVTSSGLNRALTGPAFPGFNKRRVWRQLRWLYRE